MDDIEVREETETPDGDTVKAGDFVRVFLHRGAYQRYIFVEEVTVRRPGFPERRDIIVKPWRSERHRAVSHDRLVERLGPEYGDLTPSEFCSWVRGKGSVESLLCLNCRERFEHPYAYGIPRPFACEACREEVAA